MIDTMPFIFIFSDKNYIIFTERTKKETKNEKQ